MNGLFRLGALLAACAPGMMVMAQQPPASPRDPVTFTKDVAPILYRRCAACHRPEGAAPISLITYAEARRHAGQIARLTKSRVMPPWKPEPGYGDFVGERRLTGGEIGTIERWVNSGEPEGAAADLPALPRWSAGWQLGEPDLVVRLPSYTLRADGPDVFRNFVVAVPGVGPRYVRGLEFRPGTRAVHHANIRVDATQASRRLDETDPEPGYEGPILRSADYPDGHFLGWTPGQAPPLAARDMAWRLEGGNDLVVQMHMQPTGKVERLQPAIGLYLTSEPPAQSPVIIRLGRQDLDIPPGATGFHVVDTYVLPVDAEIRAIQPHAHYRAQTVSAWATLPGGGRRPLILIRRWDFSWQDQYRYAAPFWVPAGTTLEMEYVFDNSDANPRNPDHPPARVSWGWRSSDEMADVWVQVMTRTPDDRARLTREARRKMAAEDAVGCETLIARQPDYADLRNDAASLYLELGRPEHALRHFDAVRRLQPESAVARYNVGVALEASGRLEEAAHEYESAIRLDPVYSLAHNNLGSLRLAAGRLDEARRQFEQAVDNGPENAEAHNNLGAVRIAVGDTGRAIPLLQRAIALRPEYPEAHFNLARAFAAAGRFDDARRAAAVAEAQATTAGKSALLAQIREQLRRYEKP